MLNSGIIIIIEEEETVDTRYQYEPKVISKEICFPSWIPPYIIVKVITDSLSHSLILLIDAFVRRSYNDCPVYFCRIIIHSVVTYGAQTEPYV